MVTSSWGIADPSWDPNAGLPSGYIDNPQHPFNILVAALANARADVLFAAGNCGKECPAAECNGKTSGSIMGANSLQSVLTLGTCDVNDTLLSYSSLGPSIPNMYQTKPDLVAYAHFLGSQANGPNTPDIGTSTASPVAASCVAAIRTKWPATTLSSADLFTALRDHSRRPQGQPGWTPDIGYGIINPLATVQSLLTFRKEWALVMVFSNGAPTLDLESAAYQLGILSADVDASFGVTLVDPLEGVYCLKVDAAKLPLGFAGRRPFQGPYSIPRVSAFGN